MSRFGDIRDGYGHVAGDVSETHVTGGMNTTHVRGGVRTTNQYGPTLGDGSKFVGGDTVAGSKYSGNHFSGKTVFNAQGASISGALAVGDGYATTHGAPVEAPAAPVPTPAASGAAGPGVRFGVLEQLKELDEIIEAKPKSFKVVASSTESLTSVCSSNGGCVDNKFCPDCGAGRVKIYIEGYVPALLDRLFERHFEVIRSDGEITGLKFRNLSNTEMRDDIVNRLRGLFLSENVVIESLEKIASTDSKTLCSIILKFPTKVYDLYRARAFELKATLIKSLDNYFIVQNKFGAQEVYEYNCIGFEQALRSVFDTTSPYVNPGSKRLILNRSHSEPMVFAFDALSDGASVVEIKAGLMELINYFYTQHSAAREKLDALVTYIDEHVKLRAPAAGAGAGSAAPTPFIQYAIEKTESKSAIGEPGPS